MITKNEFKKILDSYQAAENQVMQLDSEFGITLYNSPDENFYNRYNYVIRKLFENLFGDIKADLIESYIFDVTDLTFDKLWELITNE